MDNPRNDLMQIYEAGVYRVRGFDAVKGYFETHRLLHNVYLVAIGKAAAAMSLGALDIAGEKVIDGLVITKHGHVDDDLVKCQRIECIESDHPVPGDNTLHAGRRLIAYLSQRADGDAHFLFLLSGGASSLVEVPSDGIKIDDLRRLNKELLAGGLDINQINRVRRGLSRIKGGRLARYLNRCATLSLMISDVPGDDLGTIGSGLLTPVRETVNPDAYPPIVRELLGRATLVDVPDQAEFKAIKSQVVACLDDAKKACGDKSAKLGYEEIYLGSSFIEGDVEQVAIKLYQELITSHGVILIWGGEPTVKLPVSPGRGGRNQQLALAVALKIKGNSLAYFLSAGTDGTDGPTDDAGALIDGETIARGEEKGFDVKDCLHRADAGSFLAASGDLITTGPTGTNVMDLMIGFVSNS